jgi:hypothetical protein
VNRVSEFDSYRDSSFFSFLLLIVVVVVSVCHIFYHIYLAVVIYINCSFFFNFLMSLHFVLPSSAMHMLLSAVVLLFKTTHCQAHESFAVLRTR